MSRRNQIVMSDAEVTAYLESQLTVIIVSNGRDGFPHPMPMHFCVEPGNVIAMTTYRKSQKVMNFRRDPRATLLVESGEDYAELRSVVIYAETEIIDDEAATLACMEACRRHSAGARGETLSASMAAEAREGFARRAPKRLVLKFHPQRILSWDHSRLGGTY